MLFIVIFLAVLHCSQEMCQLSCECSAECSAETSAEHSTSWSGFLDTAQKTSKKILTSCDVRLNYNLNIVTKPAFEEYNFLSIQALK